MPEGTVQNFFVEKGFGFITPDVGGSGVFVHRSISGDGQDRTAYLEAGDKVTYEVEWDDHKRGYRATSCSGFKRGGGGGGSGGSRGWGPTPPAEPPTEAALVARIALLRDELGECVRPIGGRDKRRRRSPCSPRWAYTPRPAWR